MQLPALLAADVSMNPTSAGMPAAGLGQTMIDWLGQIALWGSLASILVGAAIYGLAQHAGNYNGTYKGRQLALGGFVGACLTGIAPSVINMLFHAAA